MVIYKQKTYKVTLCLAWSVALNIICFLSDILIILVRSTFSFVSVHHVKLLLD